MKGIRTTVAVLMVTLVLAACSGTSAKNDGGSLYGATGPTATSTEPTMSGGGEAQVTMKNVTFQPGEINVSQGTTVTWTNEDSFPHTVTSGTRGNPTGLFDSGNVAGGGSFSFAFDTPGTYPYFCKIHQGMQGTVIVKP